MHREIMAFTRSSTPAPAAERITCHMLNNSVFLDTGGRLTGATVDPGRSRPPG
jgi:hypothetical protein